MSIVERTIAIIFEGDDRSASAFGSVSGNLGKFKNDIEGMAGKLAGVGDSVLKLDAALLAMAVGGLAYSITKAAEFNLATAEIGTLITDTSFDMGKYRDAILSYAQGSTQSIDSINSALYAAVSAGSSWQDSIRAVAAAEQLAVAGKADLRDSTVLLMSTLNAYGAGIDQAGHYSDVFFQIVRMGQTTLPELAQSLSSVTSIAAAAGIPIETLGAAIAHLTASGMPTAEAITSLRAAIANIIDPSSTAAAMAKDLGIEFGYSALQSKGFEGVLMDVYKATGGNVEQVSALFGSIRGLTGVLALFGQDGGNAFLAKLDDMRNAGGSVAAAYAQMVVQLEAQNQMLINSMQTTFIKVGQPLLDDYAGIVGALANLFKGLNIGLDEGAFAPVFAALSEFGQQFAAYIDGIAKALPEALRMVDFNGIANALRDLGASFGQFLGGLDLTNPRDLATALQSLEQVLTGLIRVTEGMVNAFAPYIRQLADFFVAVAQGDRDAQQFAGTILAHSMAISRAGLEIVAAMNALSAAGVGMASALNTVSNVGSIAFNSLMLVAASAFLLITNGAIGVNQVLDMATGGLVSYFGNNIQTLEKFAAHFEGHIADSLKNIGASVNSLTGEIQSIPDRQIQIDVGGLDGVRAMVAQAGLELAHIPEEVITYLAAARDQASWDRAWNEIEAAFREDRPINIEAVLGRSVSEAQGYIAGAFDRDFMAGVGAMPDAPSINRTNQQLDVVAKDREATVKIEADQMELDRLKAQFDLMGKAVEWKAKLDIAHVEAGAKTMAAAFGTLSAGLQSSADIISAAFGAMSSFEGPHSQINTDRAFGVIDREMALREKMWSKTSQLIDVQMNYMNALIRRMSRGDALVKVDGAGLQPHLEAFMWEILSAIQVRVNEEGHAMLFGI